MTWWNQDNPTVGYVQDFSLENDVLTRRPLSTTDGTPVLDTAESVFKRIQNDYSSVLKDNTIVGLWATTPRDEK